MQHPFQIICYNSIMKNERANKKYTEPLYETDGMLSTFSAAITAIYPLADKEHGDFYGIELDKTAFFPEGGGQDGDTGYICSGKDGDTGFICKVKVFDTQTNDEGRILHYVENLSDSGNNALSVGMNITGTLDFDVRFSRMQNHGAEHLICGLIHNKFGYENTGFHMSSEGVVCDVDGPLSASDLCEIEKEANEIIYKNLPITVSFPTAEEAKNLEYRSKLDTFDDIRLVTIKDTDVCACCAPQVNFTGQIGLVKIIDFMPHRQGMRLTLIAGSDAYDDYVKLHNDNAKIMALLSSKRSDTAMQVGDFVERYNGLREENTSLKKELVSLTAVSEAAKISAARELEGKDKIGVIFTAIADTTSLRNLVNTCIKECGGIIAGFCGNEDAGYNYIIGKSDDCDTDILPVLSKKLNEAFCGRGGGSPKMVQGSIKGRRSEIDLFLQKFTV